MNIRWKLHLLPFFLLFMVNFTIAGLIETENTTEKDDSDFVTEKDENLNENPVNDFGMSIVIHEMFRDFTIGNALANQFPNVIPKLMDLLRFGDNYLNPYAVVTIIPYLMLAIEKLSNRPQDFDKFEIAFADLKIQNINLAKLIQSPDLIRKAFMKHERADLINNAMKVIAGKNANSEFDLMLGEIARKADWILDSNDVEYISGEELTKLIKNSPHFKKLFPEKFAVKGLDIINIYMELILSPKLKEVKSNKVMESNVRNTVRENDGQNAHNKSLEYMDKGTLADATITFYTVAKLKLQEKYNEHKENAQVITDKRIEETEVKIFHADPSLWKFVKRGNSEVLAFMPNGIINTFTMGNPVATDNAFFVPTIAPYIIHAGIAFKALKFICLLTYVTLIAQRKEVEMPHIPNTVKAIVEVPGFSTYKIINTLNNKELMNELFPIDSTKSINILKFIGGPEANLVNSIVNQIRLYTEEDKINEISVMSILDNHPLVKKLVTLDEYNYVMMKTYFNVETREVANKIVRQIQELKRGQPTLDALTNWMNIENINKVVTVQTSNLDEKNTMDKYADGNKKEYEETERMKEAMKTSVPNKLIFVEIEITQGVEIKTESEEETNENNKDVNDVQTTSQQESTKRYYCPVGRSWQQEKCGLLELKLRRSFNNEENCKALGSPKCTKEIVGDGNCLFRALCYWTTGSEDDHSVIRKQVYKIIKTNEEILNYLGGQEQLEIYLITNLIEYDGVWGSDIEVFAAAILLNTSIYVFSTESNTWQFFSKNGIQAEPQEKEKCIYLYNLSHIHFEVVTDVNTD